MRHHEGEDKDRCAGDFSHQGLPENSDPSKHQPRSVHSYKHGVRLFFPQGVDEGPDGLKLISDVIQEKLGLNMSVLMGANIANEVADEKFCETTIGEFSVAVVAELKQEKAEAFWTEEYRSRNTRRLSSKWNHRARPVLQCPVP